MTRTALAVRHVPFEDLGILAPLLEERGYEVRYLEAPLDPITPQGLLEPDLLVVLGGPVGVGDAALYPFLGREIDAVRGRLDAGRTTLGICLGAQIMAAALGAAVTPTGRVEIGYASLTLTAEGEAGVLGPLADHPVLHWHGDQFAIPDGAARLAQTPGFPNQAFAIGTHALGLQLHLEADPDRIEQWRVGHAHELASHGIDPRVIREDARSHGPELARRARVVLGSWLDGLPLG